MNSILTSDERAHLLPSGGTLTFASRVGWAKTYMKKAGLLTQPKRGLVQIARAGMDVLAEQPARIDIPLLERFGPFLEFRNSGRARSDETTDGNAPIEGFDLTPDEVMEAAYRKSMVALADEVLDRVRACSPAYFERLVVQSLIKMGYGGSREAAGRAGGKSGDGGIDGIINEDRLGLIFTRNDGKAWLVVQRS
jgi:restriction system protein